MHDEVAGKADSRIDLNRAGTPLLEIVSEPDLRSPAEAKAYLTELKLLLNYLGVSDCNMQEGSLRVDANINLHIDTPEGKIATPIVEVKNMNSFRAVERALAYEAERQWRGLAGDRPQAGRRAQDDPRLGRGRADHPRATLEGRIERLPLLPRPRPGAGHGDRGGSRAGAGSRWANCPPRLRTRLEQTYGITPYDSDVLVNQGRALVDYYIELAERCGDGKAASNWIQQDVLRWLNEQQIDIDQYPVARQGAGRADRQGSRPASFETSRGREVLAVMVASGKSVAEAIEALGIERSTSRRWSSLCRELLAANPKIVAEVKEGKLKGLGALIGQAKKKNPNVNPNRVREICLEMIAARCEST